MRRDVKTAPGRDPVPPLALTSATRRTPSPTQPPATHKAPLTLFDPYSQQMIVYTKPGGMTPSPDLSPAPGGDAAGGTSRALRLLQFALLSSVAVMVGYMLSILQTTG
jgi:hypothetical protein